MVFPQLGPRLILIGRDVRTREVTVDTTSAKAVFSAATSGIIAFLSSLLTALQGENTGFDTITDGQWVTAVLAAVVAIAGTGAVTYQVRNKEKTPV
ncbi:hypothetical protein [Paractinoplanes atraurantiacus]|uniref:Holin n=1 Tax=Paractinoplanes atraurantiacus TaxID=1036182 RepID=A0A285I8B6_9ACTN|nr:hypothetical protein [Actinoplanes atraurantiacus]SNY44220.1 hypothetical protein SAMN05421748_10743 [Actinoplanes atraurantiacus]